MWVSTSWNDIGKYKELTMSNNGGKWKSNGVMRTHFLIPVWSEIGSTYSYMAPDLINDIFFPKTTAG